MKNNMFVLKDNIKLLQRTTHPKTVPLNHQLTCEMVAYDSSSERTVILLLKCHGFNLHNIRIMPKLDACSH